MAEVPRPISMVGRWHGRSLFSPSFSSSWSPCPPAPRSSSGRRCRRAARRSSTAAGGTFVIQGVNWFGFETAQARAARALVARLQGHARPDPRLGFNAVRLPFSLQMLRSASTSGIDYGGGRNAALKGKTPLQVMDEIVAEAGAPGPARPPRQPLAGRRRLPERPLVRQTASRRGRLGGRWRQLARRYRVDAERHRRRPEERAARRRDVGHRDRDRLAAGGRARGRRGHARSRRTGSSSSRASRAGRRPAAATHWWGGNLEGVRRNPVRLSAGEPARVLAPRVRAGRVQPAVVRPAGRRRRWPDRWARASTTSRRPAPRRSSSASSAGRKTGTDTVEGRWQRQFMDFLGRRRALAGRTGRGTRTRATRAACCATTGRRSTRRRSRCCMRCSGARRSRTAPRPPPPPPPPPRARHVQGRAQAPERVGDRLVRGIAVTNTGATAARPARLRFRLDERVAIESSWNGTVTRTGPKVLRDAAELGRRVRVRRPCVGHDVRVTAVRELGRSAGGKILKLPAGAERSLSIICRDNVEIGVRAGDRVRHPSPGRRPRPRRCG